MARYTDIDPSVMELWDESKHPRDHRGRFTFSFRDGFSTKSVDRPPSKGRSPKVEGLERRARSLGTDARFMDGKKTWIPELGVRGLEDVARKGLPLPKYLLGYNLGGFFPTKNDRQTTAQYSPLRGGGVILNPRSPVWDDPLKESTKQWESGYWAVPDPVGTVHHELGHHAHRTAYDSDLEWLDATERVVPPSILYDVADEVSLYGTSEVGEFIAETFTGLMNGNAYSPQILEAYDYYRGPKVPQLEAPR